MRPIKFRAWDKEEKKMGEVVGIITFPEESHIKTANDNWGQVRLEFEQRWLIVPAEADLMQFTGLPDKNGKEIYEGDILKIKQPEKPQEEYRKIVYCPDEGAFVASEIKWQAFFGLAGISDYYKGEVIGNIHENPELMEAKQ